METRTHRAVCSGCGTAYRVADLERSYPCKKCGTPVRATAGDIEPERSCAACGAVLPASTLFCPQCGAEYGATAPPSEAGRRPESKRRAAQDLAQVRKSVRLARGAFVVATMSSVLGLVLSILALIDPEETALGLVSIAIYAVLTVFSVVGSIQVAFRPFAWSLAVAALWTLEVVLTTIGGSFPGLLPLGLSIALWLALIPTVRASRLLRENPELVAAQRLAGLSIAGRTGSPEERIEAARRQAVRRSLWWALGILAASAAASAASYSLLRG